MSHKLVASKDDMLDIRDALDKLGVIYMLLIGRPGESVTHCWFNHQGNLDDETKAELHEAIDNAFDEERKAESKS